jgi:hypothetical protein
MSVDVLVIECKTMGEAIVVAPKRRSAGGANLLNRVGTHASGSGGQVMTMDQLGHARSCLLFPCLVVPSPTWHGVLTFREQGPGPHSVVWRNNGRVPRDPARSLVFVP